jgi:hypothetical protein
MGLAVRMNQRPGATQIGPWLHEYLRGWSAFEMKDKITGQGSKVVRAPFPSLYLSPPLRRWRHMSAELDLLIALGNDM